MAAPNVPLPLSISPDAGDEFPLEKMDRRLQSLLPCTQRRRWKDDFLWETPEKPLLTFHLHITHIHTYVGTFLLYIPIWIYADIYFPDIPCYFLLYALCGSPQFNCYLRLRVFIQTSNAFIKGANAERNVKGQSSIQNERNGWKHYRSNDLEASKLQHDILDWKC